VQRHVAEKLAERGFELRRCEDRELDVVAPARGDVEQMPVAAGEAARPGEERQQETRLCAQKPGSGEIG
jgi:hypothetical protein